MQSTRFSLRSATPVFLLAAALALSGSAARASDFAAAAAQHRQQRWSAAYGRFLQAGVAGDPAAAQVALFMHRYGQVLYRTPWDMSTDERDALQRAIAGQARSTPNLSVAFSPAAR
jgi:hypothetical protein